MLPERIIKQPDSLQIIDLTDKIHLSRLRVQGPCDPTVTKMFLPLEQELSALEHFDRILELEKVVARVREIERSYLVYYFT